MIDQIINELNSLKPNNEIGYKCFKSDSCYYGINKENQIVFIVHSQNLRKPT